MSIRSSAPCRQVAPPDRRARGGVRRADGDHVVEAAVAQEGRVELADEVGRAHEQPAVALAERRDHLQQLVRHALLRRGRLAAAPAGDLLDLVDEHDRVLERVDLGERVAQRERLAVAGGGQAGGEDLDERPAQPRGDGLRERRLARAGRPEQDDRARRLDAVLAGQVRVDERHHDPPLDDLLLVLHAGERFPQAARQDAAAEVAEQADLLGLQRDDPLEVGQVALLVAAVLERLDARLFVGQQRRQPVHALAHQPLLELGQHRGAQPAVAPLLAQRQQHDPAAVAADARDRRADHDLADDRDHRDALVADRRQHLRQAVDRAPLRRARLLPHADDVVEIVVMEVPHPWQRHHTILPGRVRSRTWRRRSCTPPTGRSRRSR